MATLQDLKKTHPRTAAVISRDFTATQIASEAMEFFDGLSYCRNTTFSKDIGILAIDIEVVDCKWHTEQGGGDEYDNYELITDIDCVRYSVEVSDINGLEYKDIASHIERKLN